MIEVSHLTKKYGDHVAVQDVSFSIEKGEILGFLGPNGAGKSTTMNVLTGYLSPTQGNICVNGADITDNPLEAKKNIGYLPEIPPLYTDMTVREYLGFVYDLKKCTLPKAPHLQEICELVKISDVSRRLIKNLSKGYRQRVGIAQALVGNPEVLILDEPTVGLDPKQIIEIRNLIKRLGQTHTIILSSHILSEIQAVCKRVIVINRGTLVADGTPDSLAKSLSGGRSLVIRAIGNESELQRVLRSAPNVEKVTSLGSKEPGAYDFTVTGRAGVDIRKGVYEQLAQRHIVILGMKGSEMSLEEIFLQLTEGGKQIITTDNAPVKRVRRTELEAAQGDAEKSAEEENK